MVKQLYLYDPISNTKKKVDYKLLCGITGKKKNNLMSYKCKERPILGCYIIDDSTSKETLYRYMCSTTIKDEIWKDIEDSKGKYQISSYGRVRRVCKTKCRLLTPFIRKGKWLHVKVTINNKSKDIAIHKLVAKHYMVDDIVHGNIWHKNGNIYDNYFDNLEDISREELGKRTGAKSKSMPVLKLDPVTNEVLDEYSSMAEAGRHNYLHRETIRMCVRGRLKTAGGYKWRLELPA